MQRTLQSKGDLEIRLSLKLGEASALERAAQLGVGGGELLLGSHSRLKRAL